MTHGQALLYVKNPRNPPAARRRVAQQLAAYERAHKKRHAAALKRRPIQYATDPGMKAVQKIVTDAAMNNIPGLPLLASIGEALGVEAPGEATSCAPGRPGWPWCAVPGGETSGLTYDQAVEWASNPAHTGGPSTMWPGAASTRQLRD